MTLDVRKNTVAKRASLLDIPRTQGESKAFSRSIWLVNSDVAPPHTAVVPQVVVEVIVVNTKRDFGLGGCHFFENSDVINRRNPAYIRVRFGTAQ